ncbi:hypothetical protein DBA29_17305 [Xenophilus aerolatus]|nr:hypothetical protein [Xenophilus aerolatus]
MRSAQEISNWGDLEVLGKHHISTLPRYWITRLFVACSTVATILVIWWEPEALTHRLISQSGAQGWWLVGLLACVAVLGVADVIVNDILPDRISIAWVKRRRHFVYIGLAMGLMSMTFVFVAGDGGWFRPLVLPFWVDAFFAALVAFLDLFQRHRLRT